MNQKEILSAMASFESRGVSFAIKKDNKGEYVLFVEQGSERRLNETERDKLFEFFNSHNKVLIQIIRNRFTYDEIQSHLINFPAFFMFAFPDQIEMNEEGNDFGEHSDKEVLEEYFLRGFEGDAIKILKRNGLPTDDVDWDTYEEDIEVGWNVGVNPNIVLNDEAIFAIDVMRQTKRLRYALWKGSTEKAVIIAFKLLSSSINSRYYGFAFDGVRQKTGRTKPRMSRASEGILMVIKDRLKTTPGTAAEDLFEELLSYTEDAPLIKENGELTYHIFEVGDRKIQQLTLESETDSPLSRCQPIAYRNFKERYFNKIKANPN